MQVARELADALSEAGVPGCERVLLVPRTAPALAELTPVACAGLVRGHAVVMLLRLLVKQPFDLSRINTDDPRALWTAIAVFTETHLGFGLTATARQLILGGDVASAVQVAMLAVRLVRPPAAAPPRHSTRLGLPGLHKQSHNAIELVSPPAAVATVPPLPPPQQHRDESAAVVNGTREEVDASATTVQPLLPSPFPVSVYALRKDIEFTTYVWKIERLQRFARHAIAVRLAMSLIARLQSIEMAQAMWRLRCHNRLVATERSRYTQLERLKQGHRCFPVLVALAERCAVHLVTSRDRAPLPDAVCCKYMDLVCQPCTMKAIAIARDEVGPAAWVFRAQVSVRFQSSPPAALTPAMALLQHHHQTTAGDGVSAAAATAPPHRRRVVGIVEIQAACRARTSRRRAHELATSLGRRLFAQAPKKRRLWSFAFIVCAVGRLIGRWRRRRAALGHSTVPSLHVPPPPVTNSQLMAARQRERLQRLAENACARCAPILQVLCEKVISGEKQLHLKDKFAPLLCADCLGIAQQLAAERMRRIISSFVTACYAVRFALKLCVRGRPRLRWAVPSAVADAVLRPSPVESFLLRRHIAHCAPCRVQGATAANSRSCRRATLFSLFARWYAARIMAWHASPKGGKGSAALPSDVAYGRWLLTSKHLEMWAAAERRFGADCSQRVSAASQVSAAGRQTMSRDAMLPFRKVIEEVHRYCNRAVGVHTRAFYRMRNRRWRRLDVSFPARGLQSELEARLQSTDVAFVRARPFDALVVRDVAGRLRSFAEAPVAWCTTCDAVLSLFARRHTRLKWVATHAAVRTTSSRFFCGPGGRVGRRDMNSEGDAASDAARSCRLAVQAPLRALGSARLLFTAARLALVLSRWLPVGARSRRRAAVAVARCTRIVNQFRAANAMSTASTAGDVDWASVKDEGIQRALFIATLGDALLSERYGGCEPFCAVADRACSNPPRCGRLLVWVRERYDARVGAMSPSQLGQAIIARAGLCAACAAAATVEHERRHVTTRPEEHRRR